MSHLILVLFIFTISINVLAEDNPLNLVEVSSQIDGDVFTGTGVLVEIKGRLFTLTASHVSSGKNLVISQKKNFFGKNILPQKGVRIANVTHDIELIEMDLEVRPDNIASWNSNLEVFSVDSLPRKVLKRHTRLVSGFARLAEYHRNNGEEYSFREPMIQTGGTFPDIPNQGSWISYGGSNLMTNTRIAPGESGAPLFALGYENKLHLMGVAKQYSTYLSWSYFAPKHHIAELVIDLLEGKSGIVDGGRWHSLYGHTYREWDDGSQEILSTNLSAGDGTAKDGGDGTAKDGGDGTAKDGGNHHTTLNMDTGFLYKGQPAIGFLVDKKLIAANLSSYTYTKGKVKDIVGPGAELLPYLHEKLKQQPSLEFSVCRIDILENKEFPIKLHIKGYSDSDFDSMTIELNKYGIQRGATKYQAVLSSLGSKSNVEYRFDISGLFMADLNHFPHRYINLSQGSSEKDSLVWANNHPYIVVKGESGRQEIIVKCSN